CALSSCALPAAGGIGVVMCAFFSLPPRGGGGGGRFPRSERGGVGGRSSKLKVPSTPDPSPPRTARVGGRGSLLCANFEPDISPGYRRAISGLHQPALDDLKFDAERHHPDYARLVRIAPVLPQRE